MATYIPHVKDYIPQTESWTPDFKFLSDALASRQDRYDANYKEMNNLYGKVVYANMSRTDNKSIRDQYTKQLAPRLEQVSGLDLSLEQNVDAAKALFKPFFEDKHIVRDIVWTQRFQSQMGAAESMRKSPDAKIREKYWSDGIEMLNYQLEDFRNATREGSMKERLPEYVPDADLVQRGIEALKQAGIDGKGMEIKDVIFDPNGNWITTLTNGSTLTARDTGRVDKDGNKIIYSPAAEHIKQTIIDDPIVLRAYRVKAYVAARKWWEANESKYGSINNAKKAWYDMTMNKYVTQDNEEITQQKEDLSNTRKSDNNWKAYNKNNGVQPGSENAKNMRQISEELLVQWRGLNSKQKRYKKITTESKDIGEMMNNAYAAYMSYHIGNDIIAAANLYADGTAKREVKANPYGLARTKHEYQRIRDQENDARKVKAALLKQLNADATNAGLQFPAVQSYSGNEANASTYDDPAGLIDGNAKDLQNKRNSILDAQYNSIFELTTNMASSWSDDEHEVPHNGLNIESWKSMLGTDGKRIGSQMTGLQFYNWEDAKKYLLENPEEMQKQYQRVLELYHKQKELNPTLMETTYAGLNKTIRMNEKYVNQGMENLNVITADMNAKYIDAYNIITTGNPQLIKVLNEQANGIFVNDQLISKAVYIQNGKNKLQQTVDGMNLPSEFPSRHMFDQDRITSGLIQLAKQNNIGKYDDGSGGSGTQHAVRRIYDPSQERYYMIPTMQYNSLVNSMRGAGGRAYQEYLVETFGPTARNNNVSVNELLDTYYDTFPLPGPKTAAYVEKFKSEHPYKESIYGDRDKRPQGYENAINIAIRNDKGFKSTLIRRVKSKVSMGELEERLGNTYDGTIGQMNHIMTGANAGPGGDPTYDVATALQNQEQTGGNTGMTDYHEFIYSHLTKNPLAVNQIFLIDHVIKNIPDANLSLQWGDKKSEYGEGGIDPLLKPLWIQIKSDLTKTLDDKSGVAPGLTIVYNENIGGESGQGTKKGWVIQIDQKYMNYLTSSVDETKDLGGKNKLLKKLTKHNNTFTIFVDEDKHNNPYDIANMYFSTTKQLIKRNDVYYTDVPLGGQIKYYMNDQDQVIEQLYQMVWNEDKGVFEIGPTTPPKNVSGIGDLEFDFLVVTQEERLEMVARDNKTVQENYMKKTLSKQDFAKWQSERDGTVDVTQ